MSAESHRSPKRLFDPEPALWLYARQDVVQDVSPEAKLLLALTI
jgi:hypothetical protein